jgi:hypothetical protein
MHEPGRYRTMAGLHMLAIRYVPLQSGGPSPVPLFRHTPQVAPRGFAVLAHLAGGWRAVDTNAGVLSPAPPVSLRRLEGVEARLT